MYQAKENRYESMKYFRCGKSGLKLPFRWDFGIILAARITSTI